MGIGCALPTATVHAMKRDLRSLAAAVVDVWNGVAPSSIRGLLADDYHGHMLHLPDGERNAATYPSSIERFRAANPGAVFGIVEQFDAGDRVVTRLEARRPRPTDGGSVVSRGINISRFDAAGLLAEEWAIWSAWLDDPADVGEAVDSPG
jgi:SnoaL-like domain